MDHRLPTGVDQRNVRPSEQQMGKGGPTGMLVPSHIRAKISCNAKGETLPLHQVRVVVE